MARGNGTSNFPRMPTLSIWHSSCAPPRTRWHLAQERLRMILTSAKDANVKEVAFFVGVLASFEQTPVRSAGKPHREIISLKLPANHLSRQRA